MYNSYYRLSKNPFSGPTDPRQICMTETHREALSTLVYGILERKPFVAVIGEVGVGKTTVLQAAMLAVADQHARIIQIHHPIVPPDELFRAISEKLTAPPDPPLTGSDLERLDQLLVEEAEVSGRVVIVIDEAQGLPETSLEHLRLLSNLRAGQNGLLQIIFVGQPEFWTSLQRNELRHLRQRISVRSIIRPLSDSDARSYLEYKLRLAGSTTAEVMTDGALLAALRYGRGVPRRINIVTDNALVTGFGLSTRPITAQIVKEAAASIDAPLPGRETLRSRLPDMDFRGILPKISMPALHLPILRKGSGRIIAAGIAGAVVLVVIVAAILGGPETPPATVASAQPGASPPTPSAPAQTAAAAAPVKQQPIIARAAPPPVRAPAPPLPAQPKAAAVAAIPVARPASPLPIPAAQPVAASEIHRIPLIRLPGIYQIEYRFDRGDKAPELMKEFYGRSDEEAMNLFLMLNPLITDADRIAPGTWVHIPSNKAPQGGDTVAGLSGSGNPASN